MANDIQLPKMNEFNTPKSAVRRKRPRPSKSTITTPTKTALLLSLLQLTSGSYTVTWNFGPEDHFFCGFAWDDANCSTRQNCRSGKSEECEGFARGETCFEDTPCDSATGGGHEFVEGMYETLIPTFGPTMVTPVPSGMPVTVGPTLIPTDVPIGPPPDLEYPSDDPSDHWFCGLGIDDANEQCAIHCPSASECPVGQICYFGTKCDARTHAPSPPPTHRPTKPPTTGPTGSPTITPMPTEPPTSSRTPSAAPSMPQPTQSPTPGPTTSPTHGPLTAIQQGFFCATDWNDAITNCKMRCPSGEDPECPQGEFCFAYTGCTEEKGYPDGRPPMRSEGNSTSSDEDDAAEEEVGECAELKVVIVADDWPAEITWDVTDETGNITASGTNDKLVTGEAAEYLECIPKGCYEFTIHDTGGDGICCDHGDGSYEVYFDGKQVKNGAVFYDYETTQFGRCGETPAPSPALNETETPAPIAAMSDTVADRPGSGGIILGNVTASGGSDNSDIGGSESSSGGSIYRCVQQALVDEGYTVQEPLCSKFTDCYNEFIDMGDDWFCADGEVCVESPGCGGGDEVVEEVMVDEMPQAVAMGEEEEADVEEMPQEVAMEEGEADEDEEAPAEAETADFQAADPVVSRPVRVTEAPVAAVTRPATEPTATVSRPRPAVFSVVKATPAPIGSTASSFVSSSKTEGTPSPVASTTAPVASTPEPSALMTNEPTITPTTLSPSVNPTTSSPTLGPCDGEPCNRDDYCRSQHGFCGPDETYCNEFSIWTIDCGRSVDTPNPTSSPSLTEVTVASANDESSLKKPSGGGKGSGGGKKPVTNLETEAATVPPTEEPTAQTPPTHSPSTQDPSTQAPTENDVTLPPTAAVSGFSTFMLFGSQMETGAPTASPTPSPEKFVSLSSESKVHMEFITEAPSASPISSGDIQMHSAILDTDCNGGAVQPDSSSETDEVVNEFECTGEPCEQDAWCRSAYGTCGPGFIYCNSQAIWTATCRLNSPAIPPKEDTVSEPGDRGANSTTVEVVADSAVVPAPAPSLGLPELPKPTLPTITDGTTSVNLQAFASNVVTADSDETDIDNDEALSMKPEVPNTPSAKKKDEEQQEPAGNYPSKYDSPEYAEQWSEWAATVQSNAPMSHQHTVYFTVLSLAALLLCA